MLIPFIVSLCLNVACVVGIAFLVYLLRSVAKVAGGTPISVQRAAGVEAVAALRTAEAITGLTAEEEAAIAKEEARQIEENRQILKDDFGYDPDELARYSNL